ncbi:hypothetical protein [Paractinoplanes atraurantiacus]|uniref:hypothetical protein n=1 Tax=Paractinoplanes atraurantiacus TaxID=1036182 RepID=UPI0011777971|nr:hypothetical protein [Actinoplanes atraurantiacus]
MQRVETGRDDDQHHYQHRADRAVETAPGHREHCDSEHKCRLTCGLGAAQWIKCHNLTLPGVAVSRLCLEREFDYDFR